MKHTTHHQFLRYRAGKWDILRKNVIIETPVSLTVNGQVLITLMCTPTDLESMAVGFLFNEGLLQTKQEIELVQVCEQGDNVDVWLKHPVEYPKLWRRTSGCTGGASAIILDRERIELSDGVMLSPSSISTLLKALCDAQIYYREVGGIHTSILSDGSQLIVSAEDVGRHNSLDKIAGRCLMDDIQISHKILVTTGRISSEMIQKSSRIGASIVISQTSANSYSIDLAEKWGITLIGYARHEQFVVYTHPERLVGQTEVLYHDQLPEDIYATLNTI